MPDSARIYLASLGIQSILLVPIMLREVFWGFIGFDDCHQKRIWNEAEQAALLAVGGSIGGAIVQRRNEVAMQELNNALELRVRDRTQELQEAKDSAEQLVRDRTQELQQEKEKAEHRSQVLETTLKELQQAQSQLIQTEKMSSLGQMIAGIAHEINNPVGFLAGNLQPAQAYIQDLFGLLDLYQAALPSPGEAIEDEIDAINLAYLREDLPQVLRSMREGIKRIGSISTSLRTFSRADTEHRIPFKLHEGLDSTLLILEHRLKADEHRPAIQVSTHYCEMPAIECFPGQLNQVFMNLLANAIDALEESNRGKSFDDIQAQPNHITVIAELSACQQWAVVKVQDNGVGMTAETQAKIFENLFTTKGVGQGTGLGLAIARQIVVEKHQGTLEVHSTLGQGSEFVLQIPAIAPELIES